MSSEFIITIGRQYGSGGMEIGKKLADKMGIPFYDKEILNIAAKESGLTKELFESHDEKLTNSFLYSLVMDTYSMGYSSSVFSDMPLDHKVFLAQFETIRKLADEGPCVIVGRCADYALAEYTNCINVFLSAPLNKRIKRIARIYDLTDAKAKEMIQKTDKKRASHYNYYASKKWGAAKEYDLCLNSAALGIEGMVDLIVDYAKQKSNHRKNSMI